jgi:pyrrolidone-carboxylate peptidase
MLSFDFHSASTCDSQSRFTDNAAIYTCSLATVPPNHNVNMGAVPEDALRVLLTGFGPYSTYSDDYSWRIVKTFHDTLLPCPEPHGPVVHDHASPPINSRPIHITSLYVPVSYQAVLDVVPGLHAHPPVIPPPRPEDNMIFVPPPTDRQYDFILHVGVAGRGPLRIERQAHRSGYQMKDNDGNYASLTSTKDFRRHGPPEGIKLIQDYTHDVGIDSIGPPQRGFGDGYDGPEEMMTQIDATTLVQDLKISGIEDMQDVYTSMDAGHHLADYIYYCSLAESRRRTKPYEKRATQVLFIHSPPANQPLSAEQTCLGIRYTIMWVCREIRRIEEQQAEIEEVAVKKD